MNWVIVILGFVLMGITLEVFWTSISHLIEARNPRLVGKTYLWMFPIYAVVPSIYLFVLSHFQGTSIFIRGIFYMIGFYLLEFISGYLIKKAVGVSPWNYQDHSIKLFGKTYKTHFKGIICLEYAPVWYIYGILFEFYYIFLISL